MSNERTFYRAQIVANAEILFPSHDLKLITIKNPNEGECTRIVSSTTGETLLEQGGVDSDDFITLFKQTQKLLGDKVKEGWKGNASGGGDQQLRRRVEVLCREIEALRHEKEVLRGQLMETKMELAEFKLADANKRNEKLVKRIAVLEQERQGTDTSTTSAKSGRNAGGNWNFQSGFC